MSIAAAEDQDRNDPGGAYWRMISGRILPFQRCGGCGNAWLPPRTECPRCWSPDWSWQEASGEARLVSVVVYHTAFHEAFKDRLPYNVAVVELAEGPRLVSNIVALFDAGSVPLDIPVRLVFEHDHGQMLPRFRLA
jgi:uncharacterized OB-fold protein